MKRFVKFVVIALMMASMFGCAGNLALQKGQTSIDTSSKSLVLLPVTVSNQNKVGYQPDLTDAFLASGTDSKRYSTKDALFKEEKDKSKEYLLSFSLEPGTYTVEKIMGMYQIPLLLRAWCEMPLNKTFEVKPNSVMYLGHVTGTIVPRNGEEERAGGLVPILDQALAGFSNGTFWVNVTDNYDEDLAHYRSEYPCLQGATVQKAILPLTKAVAAAAK